MTEPATGLYGPGDYEGHTTIRDLMAYIDAHRPDDCRDEWDEINRKQAICDTLIDLAHDLDARGLVLVQESPPPRMVCDLSEPSPAYTADADLVTGGE